MTARDIWLDGLWRNNPGLVQLLGLCPLLAVTNTTINGLGLGLATLLVLTASNLIVSTIRGFLAPEIRIPAFVLIIASLVTAIDLILQAWFSALSQSLGIFVALIVTNCTLLARAEAFASRQPVGRALVDGLAQGIGFALVLIVLGALRELLGQGTLMADAELLLGPWAEGLSVQLLPGEWGLLLAILPPGAFIGLGLMVAVRQRLIRSTSTAAQASSPTPAITAAEP
ncbi:electron transport complex subunit E [Wenzhouxiangella marina]|uniref:Ion-translocating oxidoreductase complex subunit E n=1 Tax=Wenzhouxiangella marina TaxID=1579979 RepID=A0A0K0XVK2_9GAMM|nr:electron transport complex subunit E [Wenzhouxiangella marina]AKS41661.1 electron transporter RsxE [Wenzhouxiangella marina]MBB6086578.1 electron transport complex protein RnfE [Wenzhouxiangella marina]